MATAPLEAHPPQPSPPRSFLSRNLGVMMAIGLIVTAWMLLYTFTMHQSNYKAEATVIIKDSAITNRYVEPEQFYAMQTTTSTSSNPVLNTMGILKSQPISNALWAFFSTKHPQELKKLKIKTQKEWNAFYQDGSGFIKAKNQQGTDLISIQFAWTNPSLAQEALGVVVKAFQDSSRDLNKEEQISRTLFLSKQMSGVEAQLEAIRAKKSAYESKHATVSIKREGDDLAGTRMELENRLAQLQAQMQGKEKMAQRYRSMLNMNPEQALHAAALGQDNTMSRLQDELYRLQQQASLLSSSLTDNNPKVREIYAQIDQVQSSIENQKTRVMGPFGKNRAKNEAIVSDATRNGLINDMLKAQGEIQDLNAQAGVIRHRLGEINSHIRKFPGTEEGLASLEQQENTLSSALDHLRQRVLEGKMKEAQTLSNVFVVDPPRLPDHASFPNRNHLVILSLIFGLAAALAAAFLKDQLFLKSGRRSAYASETPDYLSDEDMDPEMLAEMEANQALEESAWQGLPGASQGPWQQSVGHYWVTPGARPSRQQQQSAVSRRPAPFNTAVTSPVIGSLFDTLAPVPGAFGSPVRKPRTAIRRDLTGPLPQQPVASATTAQAEMPDQNFPQQIEPALLATPDELLLPPVMEPTASVATLAESVPLVHPVPSPEAAAPEYSSMERAFMERSSIAPQLQNTWPQAVADHATIPQGHPVFAPAQGVPVMHLAPSATPDYVPDFSTEPLAVEISPPVAMPLTAASHVALVNHEANAPDPQGQQQQATALYEAQSKAMPLPRRLSGRLPAFLLDDKTLDVESTTETPYTAPPAPYDLVPRKQRTPVMDDQYFQDLPPLPPTPAAPDYPPMPQFVPPEFLKRRRKALFGSLLNGKKQQPELTLPGTPNPRR